MKKIFLIILLSFCLVGCGSDEVETFFLEEKYYGNSTVTEIGIEEFNELLESGESFGVFIYQNLCPASLNFENVLNEFLDEYQISFYKLSFSNMEDTSLARYIDYYPSFAIYHDGEFVDALDANSDDDTDYYKSVDGFVRWFSSYVELNNNVKTVE